jgi:hypothetical protein
LVHFNEEAIRFEKDLPAGVVTVGDVRKQMRNILSGSILESIIDYGSAGKEIVDGMLREYSRLTREPLPQFLNGDEVVMQLKFK